MRKNIFIILIIVHFYSCGKNSNDILIKIYTGKYNQVGTPSGYINTKGDTIIPLGKYYYCFTDTIRDFGIVMDKKNRLMGIDQKENELFEVFWFDNGSDYVSDGLFRIVKNNRIGYANQKGEIIIEPKFKCALPFDNGIAQVSNDCTTEIDDVENSTWKSNNWFYINKSGIEIKR